MDHTYSNHTNDATDGAKPAVNQDDVQDFHDEHRTMVFNHTDMIGKWEEVKRKKVDGKKNRINIITKKSESVDQNDPLHSKQVFTKYELDVETNIIPVWAVAAVVTVLVLLAVGVIIIMY